MSYSCLGECQLASFVGLALLATAVIAAFLFSIDRCGRFEFEHLSFQVSF